MGNKWPLVKIPPEVLNRARQILDEVIRILEPHFVILTPSERLFYRKTCSGLIKFLELSHELAVESPGLFPTFIKTEVFQEEYFTTHELLILVNKINRLSEYVNDAERLSENRTMEIALAFYETVKIAARRDIPGARIVFDELKLAYPSASKARKKQGHDEDEGQLELFDD